MLNRFSIRRREIATLVILVIGFVVVSGFTLDNLRAIQASAERVQALSQQAVMLGEINADLSTLQNQLQQVRDDPTIASGIPTSAGIILERISAQFAALSQADGANPRLRVADAAFVQIQAAILGRLMEAAGAADYESVQNQATQAGDAILRLREDLQLQAATLQNETAAQVAETQRLVLAATSRVVLPLLVLGAFASLLMLTNILAITSGINTLTQGAQRLASNYTGDVIVFPPNRKDEFAQLGDDFNIMATAIRSQRFAIQKHLRDLEESRAKAENATQRKTDYIANMSHELRAPIHVIMNFASLLEKGELGALNPEQNQAAARVVASGEHLLAVVNDILDIAKIEAGQLEINRQALALAPIFADLEKDVRALISENKKDLTLTIAPTDDLPRVYADEIRVRQILLNLFSNAVHFTSEGGITVSFGEGTDALTICVEDTGVGIPSDKLQDIFERFQQANTHNATSGTGLGLTITRDLVRLHNGRIWVTSEPNKGSIFCFTLPFAPPAPP